MRGLWKLSWIELKLFLREPVGAFFTLIFPLMMLLCFGSIYGNRPNPGFGGYGLVDVSVPAYAAMVVSMGGLFLLTLRVVTYREEHILRRFQPTPVRPEALLGAQVLALLLMSVLGMAALVVVGKLGYGLRVDGNPFSIAAAFVLSALGFFGLGFIIAAVVPTARTALAVVFIAFYPMLFLSGATMPREQLPEAIRHWNQLLPLTHVVNLLRGLWVGEPWRAHLLEVGVLTGMLALGVLVSAKTFRWD